jgi:putative phosphoesterase
MSVLEIFMGELMIGVISDTHGLVRSEVLAAFQGVAIIFHGGDIGSGEVLRTLKEIAPVVAVRGNCDRGAWCNGIPDQRSFESGGKRFLLIHDLKEIKKFNEPVEVVISGHSHRAKVLEKEGILYVNPGSAGPRRFQLPVTVAKIRIEEEILIAEIIKIL